MEYRRVDNNLIVRIDKGESIMESLKTLWHLEKINTAFISGIGAASSMDIGCYKFKDKIYVPYHYEGDFEITSLLGNITSKDGDFYLHLHITACDESGTTYGGHLNDAIIGGTCELLVKLVDIKIDRSLDDETGINIFKF